MIYLAGDVGGTNVRLLLAECNGATINVLYECDYESQNYQDFYEVVIHFINESNTPQPINAACIGVAGPVKGNEAAVTNLPWVINTNNISDILHTPNVTLLNDFVAISHGISVLKGSDYLLIQSALKKPQPTAHVNSVIIGAGTGLGVSCRRWSNGQHHIISSETGHTSFAPANELQTELLQWMQKKIGPVSLETLLSGRGFKTIYTFLHEVKGLTESPTIHKSFEFTDAAKVITDAARVKTDELCEKTVDCFVQIYGAAAGNAALNYYPVDEVYIAGGIAPKIKELINSALFLDAFNDKALMSANMKNISIKLILQDRVGLYGALAAIDEPNGLPVGSS